MGRDAAAVLVVVGAVALVAVEVVGLGEWLALSPRAMMLAFVVVLEDRNGILIGARLAAAIEIDQLTVDVVGQARFAFEAFDAFGVGVGYVFALFKITNVALDDFVEAVVVATDSI